MGVIKTIGALATAGVVLSACTSTEDKELEGIALSGGNAIAINSSLQIIDPWPAGVQDTRLKVPADRGKEKAAGADAAGGGGNTKTALSD